MGRSKFPGKPSKHILRKRINVLPPITEISNNVEIESNGSVTVETAVENDQCEDVDGVEGGNSESSVNQNVNKKVSIKRRLTRKMKSLINSSKTQRKLLSRMCNKSAVKGKLRTSLTRKSVHNYTCRSKTNETTNLVGKFVLPTRSVHSSRVIKPNKRFISDLNEGIALKKKVTIAKRQCAKRQSMKQVGEETKMEEGESGSFNNERDKTTFTNGHRVVLRQARLKLPNMTGTEGWTTWGVVHPSAGTQGPFSTKFNTTPSGTVICGVCGAVRFYRFVKQARKFNIYSCESCRKFIAKMIKRQACGNQNVQTTLVCNKGQGNCQVTSVVRTQQWKLTKCAYRARCPACWLKMCLRAFQMPPSLKQSLSQMLPKNMQGLNAVYSNITPSLLWQNNVEPKLIVDKPQDATNVKQRPLRFRNLKVSTVSNQSVTNLTNSDIKRQKIDLKGPRVKHVCRSASIVLGQPIATFSDGDKKCDTLDTTITDTRNVAETRTINVVETKCTTVSKSDNVSSEPESNNIEKLSKMQCVSDTLSDSSTRRERSSRHSSISSQMSETRTSERKNNLSELTHGIYADFWEGCDSEAIHQNGFFLVGSEKFTVASVCFLCGSASKESMVICSLCCEPYHRFCLDRMTSALSNINRNWKQYDWICPKCVSCDKCNEMDLRQKCTCQKCLKYFHPECLELKWDSENRLLMCSDCLKCRNCNCDEAIYSVGNLLLCGICFKQRREGNACPICRYCYKIDENYPKVMECTKCLKWIHYQCEKLSEEQYQVYSSLPDSVQYVCSCCSENSFNDLKKLINSEIKSRLYDVLNMLIKSKAAKNFLRISNSNNYGDLDLDNNNCSKDMSYINRIYSFEDVEESVPTKFVNSQSVIDIKNKLNTVEYNSIRKFNIEMEEYLKKFKSDQLLKIYQTIFREHFSWYDSIQGDDLETYFFESLDDSSSEDDFYAEILPKSEEDTRVCSFCKHIGDGDPYKQSRLLYCGNNEWVHVNCALWSSDVYEEIEGSLMNVHIALTKARLNRCSVCNQKGATIGCSYKGCHETYHFICARDTNLYFFPNKTVYCTCHELTNKSQLITDDKYFSVQRFVYIEQEYKSRKIVDKDSINCMIGSLYVKNLGKIDPLASDYPDVIIPLGFICTRLFWSTVEPWKLVPYTVSTSLVDSNNHMLAVDRNFTINHTLSKYAVDRMMREVNAWQRELERKNSDFESEDDEEQQNGTELLSPELTDAILEELPHDLLDGISVQDIFPKFSYDDLINIDYRSEIDSITDNFKKSEIDEELEQEMKYLKDSKRNKCDFYSGKIESLAKSRPTPRSYGLALNYKIDSTVSPVKKRKMGVGRENMSIYQLLQVDGNCDDTSSSECGSPTGQTEYLSWENYVSEEPVTCEKCRCTYRTQASYKRHLDSCEVLCSSESDSEMVGDQDVVTYVEANNFIDNHGTDPVVISSYQSYQSEIHTSVLNAQSFISSKQAELMNTPQNNEMIIQQPIQQVIEQKPLLQTLPINTIPSVTVETSNNDQSFSVTHPTITLTDSAISIAPNQPQFCVNQSIPLCVNQPISIPQNSIPVSTTFDGNQLLSINGGSISINPSNSITGNQPVQQSLDFQSPQSVTIQSVPIGNTILNVAPQNAFSLNGKVITNPVIQAVSMPNAQWVKQISKPTIGAPKTVKSRARSRTIAAKRTNHYEDGDAIILPAQNSTGQIIVQQIPSTNYVPTFVDAFQQPTQNMQYVATITPQTVPAQSLVQIQPDNNIISIVPGLPQTVYLQQPRVVENQLVLDSNGQLGWSQQQVQPIYYGFETIVQNTVMQSQQFLPTTVPGVLTANSSYSTTTQVFQTSKLEPVLDVASNSFVLVNPNQIPQQIVNSQPVVNSQTLVNPSQIVNPQNIVNSQQIVNPTTILNTQPIVNSSTIVNTQPLINAQPMVTTQPVVNGQSIVNSQPIVNNQTLLDSQSLVNTQPVINTQPIINSQSIVNPHVVVSSQPSTQTIVNSQPFITTQSVVQTQPTLVCSQPENQNNNHTLEQFYYSNTQQIPSNIKPQIAMKTSPQVEVKPSQPYIEFKISQQNAEVQPVRPQNTIKPSHQQIEIRQSQSKHSHSNTSHNKSMPQISHGITLPTTRFVSEQRIPTNIVTPIPKQPTSTQNRPMNRVLPMPTIHSVKEAKRFVDDDEKSFLIDKQKIPSQIFCEEKKRPLIRQISKVNLLKETEIKKLDLALTDAKIPKPVLTPPMKSISPQESKTLLLKSTQPRVESKLLPANQAIKSPNSKHPTLLSSENQPLKLLINQSLKLPISQPLMPTLNHITSPHSMKFPVNQPTRSPSILSPVNQPTRSPSILSPGNQPTRSPGILSPVNQPTRSPGIVSPVNQPTRSTGILSPVHQPIRSPGILSPVNQPVKSPTIVSPLNQSVRSSGISSQVTQPAKTPNLLSPANQLIKSPGLLCPVRPPLKSPLLLSPVNQPIRSPALSSPGTPTMKSPVPLSPVNQPVLSPMTQPVKTPALLSPLNQLVYCSASLSPVNQVVNSTAAMSPANQHINTTAAMSPVNQLLISTASMSPVIQPVRSPAVQSPSMNQMVSPTVSSPANQNMKLPLLPLPVSQTGISQPLLSPACHSNTSQNINTPVPEPVAQLISYNSDLMEFSTKPVTQTSLTVNPPKRVQERREEEPLVEPLQKVTKTDHIINDKLLTKEIEEQNVVELSIPDDPKVDMSLKLVFQKQGQDGTYKISNNFLSRPPMQVAPFKPSMKPVNSSQKTISSTKPATIVKNQNVERINKEVKLDEKFDKRENENIRQTKKETENSSSILYTIETQDGFKYSSTSVADLWSKVIQMVQSARIAHNMPPLPLKGSGVMNSVQILGLKSNGLKYLIEQLPGATKCSKYKSKYKFPPHPSELDDEYTQDHHHHHPYGSIRCAAHQSKRTEPYDMFGWLASKHRQPAEISLDTLELLPRRVNNLPMAMKFRQLKLTSKYSVGVYRSLIHGRGLFCLRDIEAGEMVIEYAGEVIRSILTDKREKYYNSKSIGCYMFRVDDNFVIDATMKGNAARFINHSCDPNCYSRVVEILGHKHIIIFALRRIVSGEELTYDYKFPFEEDKIPCTCGSRKCRKFLN